MPWCGGGWRLIASCQPFAASLFPC
jgi:hypothetical protein